MPTLSVRDLRKTYPSGIEALREISLDVSAGMFGLLGPNGAGKSTSMKTLATLIEPDQGTISLGDVDVLRDPPRAREQLGYVLGMLAIAYARFARLRSSRHPGR